MILEIRKKNFTNPASLFNLLFRFGYDDENMKALVGPHYTTILSTKFHLNVVFLYFYQAILFNIILVML